MLEVIRGRTIVEGVLFAQCSHRTEGFQMFLRLISWETLGPFQFLFGFLNLCCGREDIWCSLSRAWRHLSLIAVFFHLNSN